MYPFLCFDLWSKINCLRCSPSIQSITDISYLNEAYPWKGLLNTTLSLYRFQTIFHSFDTWKQLGWIWRPIGTYTFFSVVLLCALLLANMMPLWYPLLCRWFDFLAWRPRRVSFLFLNIIFLLGYVSVDYSWSVCLDVSGPFEI